MQNNKILIIEDDEVTALNLKISLEKQDYDVVSIASTVLQARNKIKIYEPDMVLIDISLQKNNDGIELAHYIRNNHSIPFIFLTSHTQESIISEAKETEPYGYIVKPFDPASLHTTIQMATYNYEKERKRKESMDNLLADKQNLEKLLYSKKVTDKPQVPFCHHYHLDISVCETFYKNKIIKLTKKENAFIRLLVAQLGQVVNFDQAINYVWENDGATENSVRTLVWRLRSKLPTDIIQNSSGEGYFIEK